MKKLKYKPSVLNLDPSYGLVFTQDTIVDYLLEETNKDIPINGKILEPAFGDAVWISSIIKSGYSYEKIDGYEVHEETFNMSKNKFEDKNITLYNKDFLLTDIRKKYDFVFGGFPFLLLERSFYDQTDKDFLTSKYDIVNTERLRLMSMFVVKIHKLLKDNGHATILLHRNFLDWPNLTALRKFIYENFEIKRIIKGLTERPGMGILILKKSIGDNSSFMNKDKNYEVR